MLQVWTWGRRFLLCAVLALSLCLIALSWFTPSAWLPPDTALETVRLVGNVSIDGGAPQTLTDALFTGNEAPRKIVATGHLSQDIPENLCIMLYLRHLTAELTVDGQTLLVQHPSDALPQYLPSGGELWRAVLSPGITTQSEITLTLGSIYLAANAQQYADTLSHLMAGSEGSLYRVMLRTQGPAVALASFIIGIGLVMLAFSVAYRVWRMPRLQCVLFSSCFAVLGGVWYLFCALGRYATLVLPNPGLCNTLAYLCLYLMAVVSGLYARAMLQTLARRIVGASLTLASLFALAAVLLQLLGVCDLSELQPAALLIMTLCNGTDFICLFYELLRYRREEHGALYVTLAFLPAALCGAVDMALFMLRQNPNFTLFGYGLPVTVLLQLFYLLRYVQESTKAMRRAQELEKQLKQSRISTMLSQIKPHFLYNVLNAISGLCVTDPTKADEAIMLFSTYLRANLNSIDNDALVRFERELEHVKSYVKLEQMRYGERLRVEYDIACTDFELPTLSLQPLVENAIRHGIAQKPEGGAVRVATRRTPGGVLVTVADDGVGFDPEASDQPESIGLRNIRQRLQYLCKARLTVQSAIGQGTTATILFPMKEEAKE